MDVYNAHPPQSPASAPGDEDLTSAAVLRRLQPQVLGRHSPRATYVYPDDNPNSAGADTVTSDDSHTDANHSSSSTDNLSCDEDAVSDADSSGPRGMQILPDGDFLATDSVMRLLRHPPTNAVLQRIPRGRKANVFCLLTDDANVQLRRAGKRSIYDDDCGTWDSTKGRTTKFPYLIGADGESKRLSLRNGVYCYERQCGGVRTYVAYEPQPNEADVVVMCRYYCTQKGNVTYKKRVSWLVDASACESSVALVEYSGEPADPQAHGNGKDVNRVYVRTPAATMTTIGDNVQAVPSKVVYDEAVESMDVLDAPRDTRVVRNKKYNESVKVRKNNNAFQATFADEVQTVCSMVTYDDFVQSVTLTHSRVPCVVLYSSRQMNELKAFCFNSKHGSVWAIDKTYNLGHLYVTVTVYRNLALQRNGSNTVPTFIGPLFIHGNSDFVTYATFLGHIAARLVDCNFRELRVGSDGEASIRKAVEFAFTGASLVSCTRHIKENVRRNAHKVTSANDRNVTNLVEAVFSDGGLTSCDDTLSYDTDRLSSGGRQCRNVRDNALSLTASGCSCQRTPRRPPTAA